MRSSLPQPRATVFFVLALTTPFFLAACASPALVAQLQQDEQAYNASSNRLFAAEASGDAVAIQTASHEYKLAVTRLREDRGLCVGPNCGEKQGKEGRTKP